MKTTVFASLCAGECKQRSPTGFPIVLGDLSGEEALLPPEATQCAARYGFFPCHRRPNDACSPNVFVLLKWRIGLSVKNSSPVYFELYMALLSSGGAHSFVVCHLF